VRLYTDHEFLTYMVGRRQREVLEHLIKIRYFMLYVRLNINNKRSKEKVGCIINVKKIFILLKIRGYCLLKKISQGKFFLPRKIVSICQINKNLRV